MDCKTVVSTVAAAFAGALLMKWWMKRNWRRQRRFTQSRGGETSISVHVTGFGPFCGVSDNPATHVAQSITGYRSEDTASTVRSTKVVDVSMSAAKAAVRELVDAYATTASPSTTVPNHTGPRDVVFLHVGVAGDNFFRLERRAWNNAHFRCRDESGAQPQRCAISAAAAFDTPLCTGLDVEAICEILREDHGYDGEEAPLCVVSDDPGRFVCNYLYYTSLEAARQTDNVHSLFLHIPPFSAVDGDTQVAFVSDLIDAIVAHLGASRVPEWGIS